MQSRFTELLCAIVLGILLFPDLAEVDINAYLIDINEKAERLSPEVRRVIEEFRLQLDNNAAYARRHFQVELAVLQEKLHSAISSVTLPQLPKLPQVSSVKPTKQYLPPRPTPVKISPKEVKPSNTRPVNMLITGYYTPERGALCLMKSYEAEVRMNGTGITRSGAVANRGTVSADKMFPFGTEFEIEGYGHGVVLDRGGRIGPRRLDVHFGKGKKGCRDAVQWGRRAVQVWITKWGRG